MMLLLYYVHEDPFRENLLRGSDSQSRNSRSRSLTEVSSSGEALSIFLIFFCIICAGLASGLTQASVLVHYITA